MPNPRDWNPPDPPISGGTGDGSGGGGGGGVSGTPAWNPIARSRGPRGVRTVQIKIFQYDPTQMEVDITSWLQREQSLKPQFRVVGSDVIPAQSTISPPALVVWYEA
jgi:hypothetical protein